MPKNVAPTDAELIHAKAQAGIYGAMSILTDWKSEDDNQESRDAANIRLGLSIARNIVRKTKVKMTADEIGALVLEEMRKHKYPV